MAWRRSGVRIPIAPRDGDCGSGDFVLLAVVRVAFWGTSLACAPPRASRPRPLPVQGPRVPHPHPLRYRSAGRLAGPPAGVGVWASLTAPPLVQGTWGSSLCFFLWSPGFAPCPHGVRSPSRSGSFLRGVGLGLEHAWGGLCVVAGVYMIASAVAGPRCAGGASRGGCEARPSTATPAGTRLLDGFLKTPAGTPLRAPCLAPPVA